MKNLKLLALTSFCILLSQTASAGTRELFCQVEQDWSRQDSQSYRKSLKSNFGDHYENIGKTVEALQEKSKAIVSESCKKGKHHSSYAAEIKSVWTDGCAKIVNPSLNTVCMNFMEFNRGATLEKRLGESDALKELFKKAQNSDSAHDCSPSVNHDHTQKDFLLDSPVEKKSKASSNQ